MVVKSDYSWKHAINFIKTQSCIISRFQQLKMQLLRVPTYKL